MSGKENHLSKKKIHDFCTLSLEVFGMRIILKTILNLKTGFPFRYVLIHFCSIFIIKLEPYFSNRLNIVLGKAYGIHR